MLSLWIIKHTLIKKETVGQYIAGMAVSIVIAAGTYIAGLWYRLKGGELSSYQGISNATLLHSFKWYLNRFTDAFLDICKVFITDTYENRYVLFAVGEIFKMISGCCASIRLSNNTGMSSGVSLTLFPSHTP